MAVKKVGKRTCRWVSPAGKQCREKWLQDSPWSFCSRHETIKLVEMRAKMRDEDAEQRRIPLAQAIFVGLCVQSGLDADDTGAAGYARDIAKTAFVCAEEFLGVVKTRAVG